MNFLYNKNGLAFWTQREIEVREMLVGYIVGGISDNLKSQNKAFQVMRVEAPMLTPLELINPNYSVEDYYKLDNSDDLVLRPETTMGSYRYVQWLLGHTETKTRLPICVWQHGKSFRREQDQVTKNMRLKEFCQLEFQCIYGLTTENDYSKSLIPSVRKMIVDLIGPCRIEDSDRLPDYSERTVDIICEKTNMEVCSISQRKDFEWTNNNVVSKGKNLEIAIGTDRCVFNFLEK